MTRGPWSLMRRLPRDIGEINRQKNRAPEP
jgi:hypothetical protein